MKWLCLVLMCAATPLWAQLNTQRVLAMGRNALYYEDYVVGLQYFTMCVNAKPYLGEAYYYRALAKFYLGDYTGAEQDATLCEARNPYIPNLLPLRAICRVRLKHYADAELDYRAILARGARDVASWHNLVMCQVEQKAYARADSSLAAMARQVKDKRAVEALRQLVADGTLQPATPQSFLATPQGSAATTASQPLYALNFYPSQSLVPQYEAFYGPIEQLNHEAIFPRTAYLTNCEGYVSEENIRFHDADIETTSARLAQLPEEPLLYLRRAMDYYSTLSFEAAITDLSMCVQLDTLNYLAYFLRAQARATLLMTAAKATDAQIAYGRVVDDLRQTIHLAPQFVYAYYNLGTVYLLMHDYDHAEQLLTEALTLDPHLPAAYFNRALVREANHRPDDALRDFSEAAQGGLYSAYTVIARYKNK